MDILEANKVQLSPLTDIAKTLNVIQNLLTFIKAKVYEDREKQSITVAKGTRKMEKNG